MVIFLDYSLSVMVFCNFTVLQRRLTIFVICLLFLKQMRSPAINPYSPFLIFFWFILVWSSLFPVFFPSSALSRQMILFSSSLSMLSPFFFPIVLNFCFLHSFPTLPSLFLALEGSIGIQGFLVCCHLPLCLP